MPIWKLIPIDRAAAPWGASRYTGVVIVRAWDEQEARATAAAEFGLWAALCPGDPPRASSPWTQSSLVHCQRFPQSGHPEHGPAAVLYP